eukprot:TRINITY_DN43362_c0_g1_i1.p1 TRINITY_DN43362_c0_g1~~TRINITY_DN43362_c0_g1_i1.p1  ORF type:complete len:318 (-),score=56.05 TRINITY_DN43362_c0_g1_i1:94-999(-)
MDLVYMLLLSYAFPAARLLYFAYDSVLPQDTVAETVQLRLHAEELFLRPFSRGRLFTTCEKLQVQTFYQLGHWPKLSISPAMGRRGSLQRPPGITVHTGIEDKEVLIFGRAALELTPFEAMLRALLGANQFTQVQSQLRFLHGALPWHQWSSFKSCIFLPWNFHAVSFMEFVSLDIPLLVPVGPFAYSIMRPFHLGFRQDAGIYYSNDAGVWRKGPAMPSPFWKDLPQEPSQHQFLFWYELSHMRRRPGVQTFQNMAELVFRMQDQAGLQASRKVMRAAYLSTVVKSVQEVSAAINELLSA